MLPVKHTKKFGPSKLKPTLDNHLMAYVAAASAAGVTTLALAQSAAAKIVYTPANIDVGSSYALDLNHDGIADFTLRTAIFDSGHGQLLSLLFDVPGNAVDNFARPLPIGARIGPGQTFRSSVSSYGGKNMGEHFDYGTISNSNGPWVNVTNKFLGLKFLINGEFHYGWARLTVTGAISATLTGYAYETVPNRGIRAGQRSGPEVETSSVSPFDVPAVSNLSALGLLASGAEGLAIWRRKETELA